MNERNSKLNTGLMSAMTGIPSQSRSALPICSQNCQLTISDTVAVTVGSCLTKAPDGKSKKWSSATSAARISRASGWLAALGGFLFLVGVVVSSLTRSSGAAFPRLAPMLAVFLLENIESDDSMDRVRVGLCKGLAGGMGWPSNSNWARSSSDAVVAGFRYLRSYWHCLATSSN